MNSIDSYKRSLDDPTITPITLIDKKTNEIYDVIFYKNSPFKMVKKRLDGLHNYPYYVRKATLKDCKRLQLKEKLEKL